MGFESPDTQEELSTRSTRGTPILGPEVKTQGMKKRRKKKKKDPEGMRPLRQCPGGRGTRIAGGGC